MKSVIIIAEAGVNHNGDINLAKKLIDIASEAGADFVKFQTFKAENIVSKAALATDYQINNLKKNRSFSQFELLKNLELSWQDHIDLIDYCKKRNINFLSTGFDEESIDLLYSLGIEIYKIPSGEITNLPLLRKIGALSKKVILSTGMSNLSEIKNAVDILIQSGTVRENITVLHCNTEYPTPFEDVNLKAMDTIKDKIGVKVGYSDHTSGIEVAISAVALGAEVIEKHFTLDKNLPGPDHKASLEPSELIEMVKSIRNIEKALGNNFKEPSESEYKNISLVRKSIHIKLDKRKDDLININDLIMKRPLQGGISPMELDQVIGKKINKNLNADHQLKWEDLE